MKKCSAAVAIIAAGCASGGSDTATGVLHAVQHERHPAAVDVFEVWVCDVPAGIDDALYADEAERVPLTADVVVDRIAAGVDGYFVTVSHGRYEPEFRPGGTVRIEVDDTSDVCIERALAASSDAADAVMVVATAQHVADQPGGRALPGDSADGPAKATGRMVYLGANDFHPEALEPIALDLIEHEIGHSLGLPHSGDAVGASGNHGVGPYDLLADPASPRGVDPARRDGPDLLMVDRVALGWTAITDVHVADVDDLSRRDGARVALSPSTGESGTRGAIVTIDDHRMLTVELLADTGFDDHLPNAGVVVHLVDDRAQQCGADERCTGVDRVQQVVATANGETLLTGGAVLSIAGITVTVDQASDDRATVALTAN